MRRVILPLLLVLAIRPALAQCPDGTMPPCGPRPERAPSVAILFMEPRSRNAADSLLAEGLTLEIINTLSGVARLDVKSRFFSRRIAADVDPVRSARSFGVDYVVDGVLELDSARVLVRGALTRTSTGRVVQPLRIERRRAEIEGLQMALAQEIAAAVVGRLLPAERARFTVRRVDPRVTELLFSAHALHAQATLAGSRQALTLARQAVAIDSMYAPAWEGLAVVYAFLQDFEPDSFATYVARGGEAIERAFAIDSSWGGAMSGIAVLRAAIRNDLSPRTEALARRGAALEPGLNTTVSLGFVLNSRGQGEEALAVLREAARRDSLSPLTWTDMAERFELTRHFVEAVGAWQRALALRPSARDSARLRYARRWARLETGDCAGSLEAAESARDVFLRIESLRCLGRTAEADSIIDNRLAVSSLGPVNRAMFLAWRGQPDSAFALLDRAFPPFLGIIIQNPAFDPYRQHPGYLALRRRMGLER